MMTPKNAAQSAAERASQLSGKLCRCPTTPVTRALVGSGALAPESGGAASPPTGAASVGTVETVGAGSTTGLSAGKLWVGRGARIAGGVQPAVGDAEGPPLSAAG